MWMGEGGIALLAWLLAPTPARADRIAELTAAKPDPDSLELMWGSPGLLPIADTMLERTGEQRWATAWSAIAERLMKQWGANVPGFGTQALPERSRGEILGAAHGLAGTVATLARRPELLAHERLAPQATAALASTAIREGDQANWPPSLQEELAKPDGSIPTQWCHGAPGIVTSFSTLPRDDELDELLQAGGELTWAAGPLRKGANLCHGTAGNGFAFLKLFTRTGDERWLERARRFAMHAAAQVEQTRPQHGGRGRYTLWTGDLGTAIYLQRCMEGASELPALDLW
jgi:lantibiotic modifying enzyme